MRRSGVVFIALGAVTLPSVDAHACSWSWGADLIAPNGDQHPANAAVVLIGTGLGPEQLSATIDGMAATLVVDETVAEHHLDGLAEHYFILPLRLDPAPEVGQQVAITGDPCGVDIDCPPIAIMYTATAADTTIADATPTLSFNLARFSGTTSNSCASWGSLVQATVALDEAAFDEEELVLYEVTARNDAAKIAAATHRQLSWLQFDPFVMFAAVGEDFPLDGWCVDVSMIDVAGNRGTVTTSCMPALCYDGEPISDIARIPFEPARGGSCDPDDVGTSTSSTSGDGPPGEGSSTETTTDTMLDSGHASDPGTAADTTGAPMIDAETTARGCACGADHTDTWSVWLLLAIFPASRRRRR